jgi:CRP-like cAMP-binding protein
VQFRLRSDGSAGVWDQQTGRSLEVAADEAPLLEYIDGQRTLSEICEKYAHDHGFVPFTALRDLLSALGVAGLLSNPTSVLEEAGLVKSRPLVERLAAMTLGSVDVPAGRVWTPVLALALLVAAPLGFKREGDDLDGWDVPLVYVGISLALTARAVFKAAVAALLGHPPTQVRLVASFGVLHLSPDASGVTLLDRVPRVAGHLGALVGAVLATLGLWSWSGLAFGAATVLLFDLCPFEPTSVGKLVGTLAGRVDLREHARAYLSRRMVKRAVSANMFEGEMSLVYSLVASLAWFSLVMNLLFNDGQLAVFQLVAAGRDAAGAERALAFGGAAVLLLAMPVVLFSLLYALVKAGLSLLPRREKASGTQTGAVLGQADLQAIPIFSHLEGDALTALSQAVKVVKYPRGKRIVQQGEAGDRFFAIRQGEVSVEVEQQSGLSRDVAHLGAGDCFGETALLERVPRTASVRALVDTTVAELSSADFERVRSSLGAGVDITFVLRASATLHKSRFFGKLPVERLSAMALQMRPRTVAAGTDVVKVGDPGQEFYLVGAGALEVIDPHGHAVGKLNAGDHFGEIALLRDVPRTATVRATEETTVLALSKDAFIRSMANDLTLSSRIEELAAERAEELH